jgi:AcrR family transcriptional regulator
MEIARNKSGAFSAADGRKPRADGVATRAAILDAAARLATTRGLDGLSIGELAAHLGMSKSGLYAHFKSKEDLELATIETAASIFEKDVIRSVPAASSGLTRIMALTDAFIAHLMRKVFPGGCFFATVAAQLAPQPGPTRDRVMQLQGQWVEQFVSALRQAQKQGTVARDADVDQLVFEITAMMFRANFAWIVTDDPHVLDRARAGVRNVLARVSTKARPSRRRPKAMAS